MQFKALARVTVKPLVERLPCVGGLSLTLMETPHVDFDLRVADSPDLLALPGIPLAITTALHVRGGGWGECGVRVGVGERGLPTADLLVLPGIPLAIASG